VIVHGDAAPYPQVRNVGLAPAIQFPGAANAVQRRQQPQGNENFRGNGAAAGLAARHLNVLVQRLQVEGFHERPNNPCPVVHGQQLIEREELHLDLIPEGPVHTGGRGSVFGIHAPVLARSPG
jgi:hypothetical protein